MKNVVQDLTSGGHEWMRAKWSAPIRKYWKISEQMMVKYCDLFLMGITVQHQVGCESVMLVKKDVLVLNGQKLVQGMQVHKQLMLQIMPQRIAAHHLLRLFVQLAIDKDQRLIKIWNSAI